MAGRRGGGAHTRGLSLLELVIAMALFALVAVMGMQTLGGTIRTRDALSDRDDRDRALGVALALLRQDLDRAVPVLFFPPEGPPQSALHRAPGLIALSVGTAGVPDRGGSVFQRVEWRLDPGQGVLTRRIWPVVSPARATQAGPERRVLTNVTALHLRSYVEGRGWVDGAGAAQGGDRGAGAAQGGDRGAATDGDGALRRVANGYSDSLPVAAQITLTLDPIGDIPVLEVWR